MWTTDGRRDVKKSMGGPSMRLGKSDCRGGGGGGGLRMHSPFIPNVFVLGSTQHLVLHIRSHPPQRVAYAKLFHLATRDALFHAQIHVERRCHHHRGVVVRRRRRRRRPPPPRRARAATTINVGGGRCSSRRRRPSRCLGIVRAYVGGIRVDGYAFRFAIAIVVVV